MKKIMSLLLAAAAVFQAAAVMAENETDSILRYQTLYSWDLSNESQVSEDPEARDIPVLSGSAEYNAEAENVRLNAADGAGLSLSLTDPVTAETAENDIELEFDAYFGKYPDQYFSYSITDSSGAELVDLSFTPYNSSKATVDGHLKIDGVPVIAADGDKSVNQQIVDCISAVNADGITAEPTHFRNEIDIVNGTVTVYITSGTKSGSFTGSFEPGDYSNVSGFSAAVTKSSTARYTYIDGLKISQYRYVIPPDDSELVHYITAEAEGDETIVDTSKMVYGEHIRSFLVTTARDGKTVRQYTADVQDSIRVNTEGADAVEVAPVYTYTDMEEAQFNTTEGVTLENINALGAVADGRYDITIQKTDSTLTDIYINGGMAVNNAEQPGRGRSNPRGALCELKDIRIEGGEINISTMRTEYNGTTYPNAPISEITIAKTPSVTERKTKITIMGDSLVCNYYGGKREELGSSQTGWGQQLLNFLDSGKYEVVNLANSGHYARILYETAMGGAVANSLPGDIILCQVGYNDRVRSNETEMVEYMTKMAEDAEAAGITLIFVAPPATCDDETKYGSGYANPIDTEAEDYVNTSYSYPVRYGQTVKETAEELGVGFIDLSRFSYDYLTGLYGAGIEEAGPLYAANIGVSDYIHLSYAGAMKWASFIAQELYDNGYIDALNEDFSYEITDTEGNAILCEVSSGGQTPPENEAIEARMYRTKDGIRIIAENGSEGIVYAGLYSSEGELLAVQSAELSGSEELLELPLPQAEGTYIRLFNWDEDMRPVSDAGTPVYTDEIYALPDNIQETVDLVLFGGQSNMSGRGSAAEAAVCSADAGFEYKAVSEPGKLLQISEPFGLGEDREGGLTDIDKNGKTKRTGSMVSAAAEAYYRQTGRQIVAVSASMGGTSTEEWKNGYVNDAAERLDAAKRFLADSGINIGRIFVVWSQGESDGDAKMSAETYTANTEEIFGVLKEHGAEKCFMIQTGHYNYIDYPGTTNGLSGEQWDERYRVIRDAQAELCESSGDFVLAGSFEPYINNMKDRYHYDQETYDAVGKAAGEAIANFY